MEKKFRIAIVGCGGMGSGHAVALQSGTGVTVYEGNVADAMLPTMRLKDMFLPIGSWCFQ